MAAVQTLPASPPTPNLTSPTEIKQEYHHTPSQVHTPPTTDEASHKDDDAASSSSLSDLDETIDLDIRLDDFDEDENRQRFEDAARAGEEAAQHAQIKPHHYEGGVPVFEPTMDEFRDFQAFMGQADAYGMQSGIIKIVPPAEWKAQRKALDDLVKHIRIKNPITQEFHGAQGIYTQRNMERMRSYNLPQWKGVCEQTENQPPAKRGEKRLNADKLLGRGAPKKRSEGTPVPDGAKRRGRPPKTVKKEPQSDENQDIAAPPTPTSPEVNPVEIKVEDAEGDQPQREETPSKGKNSRKPRGRQPKTKSGGGQSTETTVAARRLRNAREAVDVVDEEAFKDFDYRVYDNDQWTQERCDELEEKYWKSLNFSNPMYAADMPGSLFDEDTKEWNVAKLPNLLDLLGAPIPGVNTAYLYLGMWRATFAWHLEDVDLYSINYIHFGAPKQWYSISQKDAPKFENAMKTLWPQDAKNCDQFLRHKTYLVSPSILKAKYGVTVNKVVHREGEFIVTFPIGYHSGYNLGYNCAESVNFAIENWLQYGKTARKCQCEADSVFIDVDWFVRKMNGEPSPEFEEIEITDDEDEEGADMTPVPSGRGKTAQKRKRSAKDLGPNKRAKKIVRIRKISKNQPCCLCPNDFEWEQLLPTSNGERAHRVCAMYTPETYIATEDGNEKVFNVENISKARLDLRCHECKQKKGSCFQCSSAKCTRAYHATCAMHAGVQVDKGEIAIWHEGVEYRDVGFDWRCRLHRTVKRTRITSELSTLNHATTWLGSTEMHEHIIGLMQGDVIQWQAMHGDDIQAGVVVSSYDEGQNSLLVKVLPEQKIIREVDPASILFVDSSTSCLQRPSANALELPEELQGKTASVPGSTEKKPSEGDPFTEEPKTEWAEFVCENPPPNKWQKRVDLNKPKQVFYYIGNTSSDSKAHYTADPANPVHDPASNFMDTVEVPKMAPPPKRQSLAASYPMVNFAARNATIESMRAQMAQQGNSPPILGPKSDAIMQAAREKVLEFDKPGQPAKPSKYRDLMVAAEAKANENARIEQRKQAALSQQISPVSSNSSFANGIGIDQSAMARQKQFQQQGAQQSRNAMSPPMQSHSPPQPLAQPTFHPNGFSTSGYRQQYHDATAHWSTHDGRARYDSNSYGQYRPQVFQHSSNWMGTPGANKGLDFSPFPSPAMPVMETNSPQLAFKSPVPFSQSPTSMSRSPITPQSLPSWQPHNASNSVSHSQQQPTTPQQLPERREQAQQLQSTQENSFLGFSATGSAQASGQRADPMSNSSNIPSLKRETSSMESGGRVISSSLHTSRKSTDTDRQRRISNPSFPFKSPEQIAAMKERREKEGSQSSGSRPVSRPGSGYSTTALPSPGLHAVPYGPEPQPPMYINPTATQLTTPTGHGSLHFRARSATISVGHDMMGPPLQHGFVPPFRRSMSSSNLSAAELHNIKVALGGVGMSSSMDFAGAGIARPRAMTTTGLPQPSLKMLHALMPSRPIPARKKRRRPTGPMAEPSPVLVQSLETRPMLSDGITPRNDRAPPPVLASWSANPVSFWSKISAYYANKHAAQATIYKSPFGHGPTSNGHRPKSLGVMSNAWENVLSTWHEDLDPQRRIVLDEWRQIEGNEIRMRP